MTTKTVVAFLAVAALCRIDAVAGPSVAASAGALERAALRVAGVHAAQAEQTPWQKLVAKILDKGRYRDDLAPFPPTFGLEDIQGPADKSRTADYINVWGGRDMSGRFEISQATLVSEVWDVVGPGHHTIDQWLFTLDTTGGIAGVSHRTLREAPTHAGVKLEYEALSSENPAENATLQAKIQAKYDALLAKWIAFQP
ncbi:MAG: hypothetical protein HY078_10200 [Elusimicrobia bacterium]|nr:hypothetical protein [Elusimicrobiota bacterium]